MKKIYLIYFFSFINILVTQAQYQTAHWYFGYHAGIDFSTGAPVALTNGVLESNEGTSSISDENGNLLFYTNGTTVYTRNHTVMPGGEDLMGHHSSTQNALIVPAPGVDSLFYIFTTNALEVSLTGFHYTLVNMALGTEGEVVPGSKNIPVPLGGVQHVSEAITAAAKADCSGYWIITSLNNNIYIFSLTANGLDSDNPIMKEIPVSADLSDQRAAIKVSPDGKKLVGAFNGNPGKLILYDFDALNGTLSNEIVLSDTATTEWSGNYYGVEFSPDSKVLYATNSNLLQFDLTADAIPGSMVTMYSTAYGVSGALQAGLDGKIYYARLNGIYYLGVINDPNNIQVPDYDPLGLFLGGETHHLGLTFFPQPFYHANLYINGLKEPQSLCCASPIDFSYCFNGGILPEWTVKWDFGDGNSSTEEHPQHFYTVPGTYTVILTITIGLNVITVQQEITINPLPDTRDVVHKVCQNKEETSVFDLNQFHEQINPGNNALLSFYTTRENAQNKIQPLSGNYTTNQTVTLYVRAENDWGCVKITELAIMFSPVPEIDIQSPQEVCAGQHIVLEIASLNTTINWYSTPTSMAPVFTGSRFETPLLDHTKSYWVEAVSEQGCTSERKEVLVVVYPTPELSINQKMYVVCEGETVTLMASTNTPNIIRWYENSETDQWMASGNTFTTPPVKQAISYWVAAQNPDKDCITPKEEVIVTLCLTIPKGISPNGDGKNDYLDLSLHQPLSVTLFNRYGTEIYHHGKGYSKEWFGQDNRGNLLPSGTYFYRIITIEKEFTGYIYLSREIE